MDAMLLVADAATDNHDGTFSALRAGITELYGPAGKPVSFQIAVILRLWFEASEANEHSVEITIRNEDGKVVGPKATGKLTRREEKAGGVPLVMRIAGTIPHGRYEVDAVVDGQRRAFWPFVVRPPTAAESGAPPSKT